VCLQLSYEQSVGDVRMAYLNWKRVPQEGSCGCKSSVTVAAECSWHHASRTLVYCGQTVGWIKMKLGLQVGIDPGHIVLDGDPALAPQKGHSPQFSAHICCGQTAGWIKTTLGTEVSLGPGHIVLDGDPAPLPKRGPSPLSNFRTISIVAKLLDASRCHLVWR